MPLQHLSITVEHTGTVLTVLYDPEEYTINTDNNFATQGVPGLGSPVVQFVNGNQRTLELELFFDTWDTDQLPKQDVRGQTQRVADLMRIDPELHAPPVLVVAMASLQFRCVLSRASQRFVLLTTGGVPVRARMNCTFIEYLDPEQEAKAAGLQSVDFSKVHVVARDESVSGIAGVFYDDPRLWRPIAIANGLANPRSIRPGQALRIPSLPFVDPDSREVRT
jgi:Contractile injection system tube protein/LysM domain